VRDKAIELLASRGVAVREIALIVQSLQQQYLPDLSVEECEASVMAVLDKREAQHAIFTGIALDILAEKGQLPEPLSEIVRTDEPLYGVDEILALAITNIYGSVGLTSFGYLDKVKHGVIGELNKHAHGRVNTFLDDLIAGVAAAAAARIAHQRGRVAQKGGGGSSLDE